MAERLTRVLGGGATRSLPKYRGAKKIRGNPTVGPRPRTGPDIKSGRNSAKDDAPETQMRDNPERRELDPALDDRRRCKKNSPSVLSCRDNKIKEVCDRGSKVETVPVAKRGRASSTEETEETRRRENCKLRVPFQVA